jgi:hypothetical protein
VILVKGSDRIGLDPFLEGHLQVFEARNVADEIREHVDRREFVLAPKDRIEVGDANYISVEILAPHSVKLVNQKVVFRLTQFVEWHPLSQFLFQVLDAWPLVQMAMAPR